MTENVFIDNVAKKLYSELTKACIRRDYPPHIAWWRCNVIDMVDRSEHIEQLAAMTGSQWGQTLFSLLQ